MLLTYSEILPFNIPKVLVIIVHREIRVALLIEFITNWHGTGSNLMLLSLLTIELLIKIFICFKVIIPTTVELVTVFSLRIVMR